jgi:hypothetical protein
MALEYFDAYVAIDGDACLFSRLKTAAIVILESDVVVGCHHDSAGE